MNASDELGRINAQLRAELERETVDARQGKRPDQVEHSAMTLFLCFAVAVAWIIAAWLWRMF